MRVTRARSNARASNGSNDRWRLRTRERGDGGAGDDGRGGGSTPRGLIRRVSDGSDDSAGSRREKFSPVTFGGGGAPRADCLVLDLDGTLLDRRCVVTPATAAALAECARRGVAVFIATGKARPAAIRAVGTAGTGLDGARTGICSLESPGVFLQGLDVFGRGGEGDGARRGEAEVGDPVVDVVVHQAADAVARLDPEAAEVGGQGQRSVPGLRVAELPRSSGQRDLARRAERGVL